jgi:hypothetical protein
MNKIHINNPQPFGPLDRVDLQAFQESHGYLLPADYRDFLLKFNGGRPSPSFFWIEENVDGSSVYQFYGLYEGSEASSIDTYSGDERYGLPSNILPIGDDGVGDFICIGISNENYGEIYFFDHETHPYNDPDSKEGITKLANSFDEFLTALRIEGEDCLSV